MVTYRKDKTARQRPGCRGEGRNKIELNIRAICIHGDLIRLFNRPTINNGSIVYTAIVVGNDVNQHARLREMIQYSIPSPTTNLFEFVIHQETLKQAFKQVRQNQGSPGIDGVTTDDFASREDEELASLQAELANWRYRPAPVRRVEIPKPDNAGVRLLGVPNVRDRVVQAAIKIAIEPIFDPMFSDASFGFRPGRNQHQAIEQARQYVQAGKEVVVDIDLSKFFDRINHDRLIALLRKRIDDKRILRLIGMTLRSGVMTENGLEKTTVGSTQGSPLSPLLSNVILDVLDKKLEQRGLSFVRYADDCNIFVRTVNAGKRVMENIQRFIENNMKLVINQEKSKVARSYRVTFLGVTIVRDATVAISKKAMKAAKAKIKQLLPRGTHLTLEESLDVFNRWFKGWSGYYQITQYPAQFKSLEAYARRRLRARFIAQLKRRKNIFKRLKKRGVKHRTAANTAFSNHKRWALSKSKAMEIAYPNKYFEMAGMFCKSKLQLPHWFDVRKWVYLT